MFCPKCGAKMAETAKFCPECGKPFAKSENRKGVNVGALLISLLFPIVGFILWGLCMDSHPKVANGAAIGCCIWVLFFVGLIAVYLLGIV